MSSTPTSPSTSLVANLRAELQRYAPFAQMAPAHVDSHDFRVVIGAGTAQPYSASVFNISAMSFGSLSANAVRALNEGARRGNFYHDTGEGSISPYHREKGGDLVWEIGSGYFGCRDGQGRFSNCYSLQLQFGVQEVASWVRGWLYKVARRSTGRDRPV